MLSRGVRGLSTWSPLANAFNSRPAFQPLHIIKQRTGLFNRPELTCPEGLYGAKDAAIRRADELVAEATGAGGRPLVHVFDELSDTLCKVADLAEFLRIAHPDARFASAAEDVCVAISALVEKLNTETSLYEALAASSRRGDSGDAHVATLFLTDFEQSGIHLGAAARARVRQLQEVVLHAGQRFVHECAAPRTVSVASLPLHLHKQVSGATLEVRGLQGEAACSATRELAYRAFLAPEPQQEALLTRLLTARRELATLCGFRSYADRAVQGGVLESGEEVGEFLQLLTERLRPRAERDFTVMRTLKRADSPDATELGCWDTAYYTQRSRTECVRGARVDPSPYFSLGAIMHGLDACLQAQFGISLQPLPVAPGEVWCEDVYKVGVVHESEGLLGYVYCDLLERAGKPHHDCHFTIQAGRELPDQSYQLPVVVVMMSICGESWAGPPMLNAGSLDNLCHEFGHALHSLLGRTRFQHVAGTRCPTDLAELPSMLAEQLPADMTVSAQLLRHVHTGHSAPHSLRSRLSASRHVFAASEMQLQVFYSALDQMYHAADSDLSDTTRLLQQTQQHYYSLPYVSNTAWHHRFSHLVGYGAKYYSYLISRALAWLVWRREFDEVPLSRAAGERLRRDVLAYGGSRSPRALLRDFLHADITPRLLADALVDQLDTNQEFAEAALRQ